MTRLARPLALTSFAALTIASFALAAPAAAQQVGYPPSRSPYHDVESSQRITLFGGEWLPQHDEIGATPQSGPLFGLRYEVPVGGPALFTVRGAYISSHRTAFDPTLAGAARSLGDTHQSLVLADIGFLLAVTGQRSWHSIIPTVGFGLGVITGGGTADRDPYRFGTQFAMSATAGVRIVPSNSLELVLEGHSTLYQNHYPSAYFATTTANATPLLDAGTARSGYRNAWSLTAGLAVPIFR